MIGSGSARLGTLGALVLTLLLAAAAGAAFAARASNSSPAASAKFTDASGDSGSAPDIQSVVVSSDASHVTVTVNIPAAQTAPADAIVGIEFDTDQNWATGNVDLGGAEYEFQFQGSDNRFALYHWNGTSWSWVPAPSAAVSFAGGLSVTLNLSDLGSPTGFNFWTWTGQLPDINSEGHYDDAPDSGTWNYQLAASVPPKIVSVLVEQKPLMPRAGRTFKLIVDGLKVDPSEGLVLPHPDTVACSAKLNGKRLAGSGLGGCAWKLPASAKGKRLTLGVTVTYKGARATFALGTERVG